MTDCNHGMAATQSSSNRSIKSDRKKTIEIFVGPGQFSDPSYQFFDSEGEVLNGLKINPKKTYLFKRLDGAVSHPFYISDRGYAKKSSSGLKLKGDGSFDSGITGEESFVVSFKKKVRRSFAKGGDLFFYCTSHQSMFDAFDIKSGKRQSSSRMIVDPSSASDFTLPADLLDTATSNIDSPAPINDFNDASAIIVSVDQVSV